jgi:hypothetical protein
MRFTWRSAKSRGFLSAGNSPGMILCPSSPRGVRLVQAQQVNWRSTTCQYGDIVGAGQPSAIAVFFLPPYSAQRTRRLLEGWFGNTEVTRALFSALPCGPQTASRKLTGSATRSRLLAND